jgi:hypothetical protein
MGGLLRRERGLGIVQRGFLLLLIGSGGVKRVLSDLERVQRLLVGGLFRFDGLLRVRERLIGVKRLRVLGLGVLAGCGFLRQRGLRARKRVLRLGKKRRFFGQLRLRAGKRLPGLAFGLALGLQLLGEFRQLLLRRIQRVLRLVKSRSFVGQFRLGA